MQAIFHSQIVKEIFRPIRNKVIFLDGWDMGTAIENMIIHPHPGVPKGMVMLLMSFVCDSRGRGVVKND